MTGMGVHMKNIIEEIEVERYFVGMTQTKDILETAFALGLNEDCRILDLCCGYGEMLRLYAEHFGCCGIGVDRSSEFIEQGRELIRRSGLADKVSLVMEDARTWNEAGYDVASIVGAQDVFGGFEDALRRLLGTINASGKVVIGTPYYHTRDVPQELVDYEGELETEPEIFEIVRNNCCVVTSIARGSRAGWDRYISWSARRGLRDYRNAADAEAKKEIL